MPQDASLLELSSAIYEAIDSPRRWPGILRTLKTLLGAGECVTVSLDKCAPQLRFAAASGGILAPPANGRDGFKLDRRVLGGLALNLGEVFAGTCPKHAAECREIRLPALGDEGGGSSLGLVVANDRSRYAAVLATRPARAPEFGEVERRLMAQLSPHLCRGYALARRLRRAERERRAALAALDRLAAGVIVVDAEARVGYCNGRAEEILGDRNGLRLVGRALKAESAAESAALREAILRAAKPRQHGSVTVLSLSRPSMSRPLELLVAPLLEAGESETDEAAGALVFLADPERRPHLASEALAHLYGLSQAEAELTAELVSGKTLAQIADERARNVETARKTLKRVFAKTETGRQAELIGRLLSGPLTFVNGSAVGG